ncbi:hypothetical protein POJ06DRAFT_271712 [Lipomyces tetrasporus]|uniref:Uncharacterized protein n=1 Tax=Lipomyces tetrasporus TaxID=54092 RepID=A0AAD7QKE1_9ASCO|nr:uncharacterized protein POJ06DRAFT_271712 [Lipomyces tetrasporus]KAJ8096689.1 hypothetical protein POJ06DRAFT_271712 [Lipomyces tetrasporus]
MQGQHPDDPSELYRASIFGNLRDATANCLNARERVWAQDTRRTNGNIEYVGKTFLVATCKGMFDYLRSQPDLPSVYEVIATKEPCRLYLDMEMLPAEYDNFTETELSDLVVLLRTGIQQFLDRSFPGIGQDRLRNDRLLQACDSDKFSVHYVHPEIVFDNAVCSQFAFVFELQLFLRQYLQAYNNIHLDSAVDRAISEGVVDFSVYRMSQQLRLGGNTKLGKVRPLRMVGEECKVVFPRTAEGCVRDHTFRSLCPTFELFLAHLVSDRSDVSVDTPLSHSCGPGVNNQDGRIVYCVNGLYHGRFATKAESEPHKWCT